MARNPAYLRLLARLQRVRAIERKRAMIELAEALSKQRHHEQLEERSRMLSADYAVRSGAAHAAELQQDQKFRSGLEALSKTAGQMSEHSGHIVSSARLQLNEASQRLDVTEDKLSTQKRRNARVNRAQPQGHNSKLARTLLSRGQAKATQDQEEQA